MTDSEVTERVARALAAYRMAMIRDPKGLKLPAALWNQDIPLARVAIVALQSCFREIKEREG